MILLGGPESLFKHIGLKKIVRIQKGEVFAHGMAQAVVARGAGARIFLADHLDAWILCGQPLQNGGGIIRRAIVDAQNLEILKGLGSHGMQALFQMPLCIVNRNDHGNGSHLFSPRSIEARVFFHLTRCSARSSPA